MERIDGRKADELRPMRLTPDFTKYAEGSVLIEHGNTMVLCNASFTEGVPRFLKDSGRGWLTAEYDMLPRANRERSQRDIAKLKVSGRSAEIQRLIGRSLRSVVDMSVLGENTIVIDCDARRRRYALCIHYRRFCRALYGVRAHGKVRRFKENADPRLYCSAGNGYH